MDTALKLRMAFDAGDKINPRVAQTYLDESLLFKSLTHEPCVSPLAMVWRLIALSEIPFSQQHVYTQELVGRTLQHLYTGAAFALDGKNDSILPCYNGMLVRALIRLGVEHKAIHDAVNWILQYQPLGRNEKSIWSGSGVKKYGGCYANVPCYIGVVKSTKALLEYNKIYKVDNIQSRIEIALEYILSHQLLYRLSSGLPVTSHILDLSFPESYNLNVVELLLLLKDAGKLTDARAMAALQYVESKKDPAGYWKINYAYKAAGYLSFDRRGKKADWLTYLLSSVSGAVPV